jgi:KTSC domain
MLLQAIIAMPSSVVANFKYNRTRLILRIFFVSGSVYDYFRVPETVYDEMRQSGSKGTFLNLRIKGVYRFKKIK